MQDGGVAKQIARWVALGALFLVPLTPLIVANTYFFPFISGKAFFFRILIEIAISAWVVLALLDKQYRPRFSWIGAVIVAFVAWMFIADLSAINVTKAFWSNFERMEGWVWLAHLLAFFFTASNVLRVEKKWRAWFLATLAVAVVITVHAFFQLGGRADIHQGATRIDASFGNSAYLAIYLLFNVFIASWLALTEKRAWLKWTLLAFATVQAVLIFFTETRGAILGLVGALFLTAVLTALTAGREVRRYALYALVVLVFFAGMFYIARDSSFVQENRIFKRVASISLADGQTRFTIWNMALQGVKERPIVGWGQEGFNYIFNKYYDPSLYGQESWFDRAHNAFIDWLTAGGIPAFLLYLSLFGSALWLLWSSSELSRPERIALTGALVGYAFHNLFVFDNLYSYIYFFAILALIDSQVGRTTKLDTMPEMTDEDGLTLALPIVAVVMGVIIWLVNVTGMQTASTLIKAMSPSQKGITENVALFQGLLAKPPFAAQEIREQLVSFATSVVQSPSVADTDKQQIVTLAITEIQKQVADYPEDARQRLQLAYMYRTIGDHKNALKEILVAAELSPRKEEMWIEAGATAWDLGDTKAVKTYFDKAYALGAQFSALAAYAAAGDIAVGDIAGANKILLAAYGTTTVDSNILAVAYYRAKNWSELIKIWKIRAEQPGATVETWFNYASAYYAAGDTQNAIATVNKTVELFPQAAKDGAAAIKQIQGQ